MKTLPHTEVPPPYADDVFTGTSPAVQRLRLQVARIAPHFRIALLTGEPGVGKYAVARQMHHSSPVAGHGFTVISSTEFAQRGQSPGENGTVYIPGLESLHPASQGRLLRAIKSLNRETRVVVASQCDLKGLVSAGRMRHDLYDTVGTLEIRVAPLRDRIEDLQPIVVGMMRRLNPDASFAPGALLRLHQHSWPGNLEELWGTCQTLGTCGTVSLPQLTPSPVDLPPPARLEEVMYRHVMDVLQSCAGNKLRAAEALGISRSTLYRMLENAAI
jgi:two-component system response regulator HydG